MVTICKYAICLWLILRPWISPLVTLANDANVNTPTTSAVGIKQLPTHKTREELFLEIFKRPAVNIPVSSYILFVVNGNSQQKVKAILPQGDQDILLEGKQVIAALSGQQLLPEIVQDLNRQIDVEGWLNQDALEKAGISTTFNPSKFEILATTDPRIRKQQIQYLTDPMIDPFTTNAIRPSKVSAFINFDLKGLATNTESDASTNNDTYLAGSANGAINIMGVVVEGSIFSQIGDESLFGRGDVLLVYDQPQRAMRYTLGDLRYPVIGYQKVINMFGIGMSKDFSLQPHVRTYRTENFELYLEHPSEVQVWVNDSLVSTLQLFPGTHDIRGFTPAIGQNNTRLVIEDNAGRKEVLHSSYIFNPTLMAKGGNLFSYNVGFERSVKDGIYHYDLKNPVLSASYMLGLTDETTAGGYVQAETLQTLLGVKTIHAFPANTVELDMAVSAPDRGEQGVGAKITWSQIPDKHGDLRFQPRLTMEYLSKNFNEINTSLPAQSDALNLYASLAFAMGNGLNAQIGGAYMSARLEGLGDEYKVDATLTRKWGKYTITSATLRQYWSNQHKIQTEFLFGLSFNFSKGVNNFYLSKEMESNAVVSRWDNERSSASAGAYGFASTRLSPDQVQYQGGIGYVGSQGLAEISHTQAEINQHDDRVVQKQQTAFHLQSTLVLANTTFALSRPVTQNFAIIKGKDGLADVKLKVDSDNRGGSKAQSSWISPAVLVNLPNYRLQDMSIEPINPPLGATPEKMTFSLASTYKSGFILELGQERKIVAVGKLVDSQKNPLIALAVEIQRIDDLSDSSISTFTSRSGRFQMLNIKPGRYEIRPLPITQWGSVIAVIPETNNGVYRLGDITVMRVQSNRNPF